MNPTDEARNQLVVEFRQTTLGRIEKVNLLWIALENDPGEQDSYSELLRELHTIKGESRMMGFSDVSLVAHRVEELLIRVRESGNPFTGAIGDVVLGAADAISKLVLKKAGSQQASVDLTELMSKLDSALAETEAEPSKEGKPSVPEEEPPSAEPKRIFKPSPPEVAEGQFLRVASERVGAFSNLASELVVDYRRLEHSVKTLQALARDVSETLADIHLSQTVQIASGGNGSTVEFGDGRAIELLQQMQAKLKTETTSLSNEIATGELRARKLDHEARQLRLVPIGQVLTQMVRVVRDLSREQKKNIRGEIQDNNVVLDKNVVDRISEPLLHLARNAVDHGMENPDERERLGKPNRGQITFSAEQTAGYVTVTITDDGRGIDPAKINERAQRLGLIGEDGTLSKEETLGLLFRSGFSTLSRATETSGRGVGLDIVKRQVELLGGAVRVHSEKGSGTRFELQVPVSIALTRVLVLSCGDELFALPSTAVDGVLEVERSAIENVHNRRTIRFRDQLVMLVDLASLLDTREEYEESELMRVVVISHDRVSVALRISNWSDVVEVVVKSLGDLFDFARIYAGACVLRAGDLALVLSPPELIGRAHKQLPVIQAARPVTDVSEEQKLDILLVEDSAITRNMIARILDSLDYQVHEAKDGQEAVELLENTPAIRLILTDIEMPRMNGIELIERVRSVQKYDNLPIVVLSTRGTAEDKQRALKAGADAYLVKMEFSETALRETLRRQLGIA